jgi:hypothetical protein
MKRPALIIKLSLVRLPVCEALAFHALHSGDGPVNVTATESDAVIVAEIELGQIAVKVLFFAMLIVSQFEMKRGRRIHIPASNAGAA